ncbi:hypothetical protein [Haloarchaeobius iranensis]|uniref:Uncharacterized protein n=1 Tax=Haloarchaeobius iranensis TaxID=996166 RepID=A0A1H0BK53_9EURY|nr:hypothetical protein [Haloarchaeobius iranensis]SDN45925.1 hypothetical protein SAMN05192554_1426 [Haloarchaeobius iranensis]
MPNPLFSTYTQGENRVTSTLVAVLEHINNQLAEDILEALTDESDLSLVSFENQVTGVDSVPDAAIRSSTALWFETKTSRDSVDREQLERHLQALDEDAAELQRLIVLTPDSTLPEVVTEIGDERIVWANFDGLLDTIESVLERDVGNAEASMSVPTEREAFLLRELSRFLYDEDLVSGKEDRVLLVAARKAWPEYEQHGLYFCQPNRSFKPVDHLAFYTDGEIKTSVPTVTGTIESIELTGDTARSHPELSQSQREQLLDAVEQFREQNAERYGETEKVLFLEEGIELDRPVVNDKTARDSDRRVAFVQGHRYVSFSKLRENPEYTTALEDGD